MCELKSPLIPLGLIQNFFKKLGLSKKLLLEEILEIQSPLKWVTHFSPYERVPTLLQVRDICWLYPIPMVTVFKTLFPEAKSWSFAVCPSMPLNIPVAQNKRAALLAELDLLPSHGVTAPVLEPERFQRYYNIFKVPNLNDMQLVLNLKLVQKFHMDSLRSVIVPLHPGYFLALVDIKDTHLHSLSALPILAVSEQHFKFVAFWSGHVNTSIYKCRGSRF